jgi:5-methylcytosine-specific restriction endonuclease McrA
MVVGLKQCTFPGCSTLGTTSRCDRHPYPDRTGPVNPKYQSARWARIRAQKLRNSPVCEQCHEEGRITPAKAVDHKDGDPDNDAPENLRSMCIACHSRKTAAQDGGFGRAKGGTMRPAIGLDGWPVGSK